MPQRTKTSAYFIIILSVAAIMLFGVVAQNILTVLKPKTAKLEIDVDKVIKEIESAGLHPREALHWK